MKERLKLLISALNQTQRDFAESIGLKPAMISDILYSRAKGFSNDVLLIINQKYNVNLNWLLTGEGEMFLTAKKDTFPPLTEEKELSKTEKWILAAMNDPDMDEKMKECFKEMLDNYLKGKKSARLEKEVELSHLIQKGEAG